MQLVGTPLHYDSQPMPDLKSAVQRHVDCFNNAVRSGVFDDLAARFADDAVMRFVGVPIGPFEGRPAILAAYESHPPDDEMTLGDVAEIDGRVRARFSWNAGGGGTMSMTYRGALLTELVVEFDTDREA